jgi:hypothetical protein
MMRVSHDRGKIEERRETMGLMNCPECGKAISDKAISCPHCGVPRAGYARPGYGPYTGYEYRSEANLLGLPLVHIAYGFDSETGRKRVAKGVIAFGDIAVGVIAFGGLSFGVISLGGCALGLAAMGGLAIGLVLAVGGLAIGSLAFGGVALGGVALGGCALGYYAYGGGAWGAHVCSGAGTDPVAVDFYNQYLVHLFGPLFGKRLLGP